MVPSSRDRLGPLAIVLSVLLLAIAVKLPRLAFEDSEGEIDEVVYWSLAQNLATTGSYGLRGTEVLSGLSPQMYDRPTFHHPPLYPILLVPFALHGSPRLGVLVSWLGHLLCIVAVAIVALHLRRTRGGNRTGSSLALWLPLVGVAFDPLLTFVSRKLWMDALLAGLVALSLALLVVAPGSRRRRALLLGSGVLLGLAGLTKLPAMVLAPVFLVAAFLESRDRRTRIESAALPLVPALMLVVPWLLFFHAKCGVFLPSWVRADPWLLEHSAFVRAFVSRPWYYYVTKLPLLIPLFPVCLFRLASEPRASRDRIVAVGLASAAICVAAVTAVSADGVGFLMRHVSAVAPCAYFLLAHDLTAGRENRTWSWIYVVAIAVGIVPGATYWYARGSDEIFSLFERAGWIRF